jgi:hypothetical protein
MDGSKNCLTTCPLDHPYYNDTSTATAAFTTPQLCVSSCDQIPGPLRLTHPADNYRCSLAAQMPQPEASKSESNGPVIAGVVVGLAVVVAVGILLILHYRARKRTMRELDTAVSPQPSHRTTKLYDNPASPASHVYDEFVFDPALDTGRVTGSNELLPEVTTSFLGRPAYAVPNSPADSYGHGTLALGRPGVYDYMESDELETSRL